MFIVEKVTDEYWLVEGETATHSGSITWLISLLLGARCSSVVRAFAHGGMGRRINPSWGEPIEYFSFQPVLHDWCYKGCGMCYPVCAYNRTLAVNWKE